jgi:epoxide hydrolase-like predicted phosphatase
MIKVVLFDYGGVLSSDGKAGTVRELFEEIRALSGTQADLDMLCTQLLHGTVSSEAFLDEVSQERPAVAAAVTKLFLQHIFNRNAVVYAFAARLREQHIRTGIFSNVFAITAAGLREHGQYDGFDPVLLSCEEGLTKPDGAFYDRAIAQLGVEPGEILFIDDQPHNLVPALERGMHTLLALSSDQVVHDACSLLLVENDLDLRQAKEYN